MSVIPLVETIFSGVFGFLDNSKKAEVSIEEVRAKVLVAQNAIQSKVYEIELASIKAQEALTRLELEKGSWIQKNWRPITMLTFLFLIVCDAFAILPKDLNGNAWRVILWGMSGYIIGRSVEKKVPKGFEGLFNGKSK